MRPLLISEEQRQEIARVRKYAEANPIPLPQLVRDMTNPDATIGNNESHVCELPFGFRVVFSIEHQAIGVFRHLSVSVDAPGKLPSVPAVEMIMQEFGFHSSVNGNPGAPKPFGVWVEEDRAINVVERKES